MPGFRPNTLGGPCRGYSNTSLCLSFITYKMESRAIHLQSSGLKEKIYTKDPQCLPAPTRCSINSTSDYPSCFSSVYQGSWRWSQGSKWLSSQMLRLEEKWAPCDQVREADPSQLPISYRKTWGVVGKQQVRKINRERVEMQQKCLQINKRSLFKMASVTGNYTLTNRHQGNCFRMWTQPCKWCPIKG